MITCKRCGKEVPPWNNAEVFDRILSQVRTNIRHNYLAHLFQMSVHLLPVIGESGEVACVGSPSRFQYFEGYPRDPRGKYEYCAEVETEYRRALQEFRRLLPLPEQAT
jgi:hypothetical protein